MSEQKRYLGDAVYVDVQGDSLVLTTGDGRYVVNSIYLGPKVYAALVEYVFWQRERAKQTNEVQP